MSDFILAEFKGTYRAPHPDGVKDAGVVKPFHVKVKMKREFLSAPGLNGLFACYYKEFLRKHYPDMLDTYIYDLIEATELDGKPIYDPKALSHEALIKYISDRRLPISPLLYSPSELRNQVVLYAEDPKGQQFLEGKLMKQQGNQIAISASLQELDDVMVVVTNPPSVESLLASGKKVK